LRRLGPDGKRLDDGLKRNQFGRHARRTGSSRTSCSFFAGYQKYGAAAAAYFETLRSCHTATDAAGDLTTFASPQCNGGRQVAVRAPYSNNRIDPALFSKAALNL
jgi:hypothetical protein